MKQTIKLSLLISQLIFIILLPIWLELTLYLHPIVIGVVWFLITILILFSFCYIKREKLQLSKHILQMMTFLYTGGLIVLLFFRPGGQSYGGINLIPFDTIRFYLTGHVHFLIAFYNLGANIALFIPFGLYYRYAAKTPHLKHLLILAFCAVGMIECLQFLTKRGSLDIDDLMLNILGVCLGYLIHPFLHKVLVIK
ncbi:VanZ family protein [Bacillus benzoevorans]|uniref:Glycopeptide antibiotics resistance protein n=1 Tax=Bacillus benzoevorans TaxID=1456 RepID=A0A7X0LVA5_9BACI|nr:VanZ family protein [Bacillus benzoevorans]MBB6444372.1 glycopeptide antibiotics resistance protein [Bacillus benzoevorans]